LGSNRQLDGLSLSNLFGYAISGCAAPAAGARGVVVVCPFEIARVGIVAVNSYAGDDPMNAQCAVVAFAAWANPRHKSSLIDILRLWSLLAS
jgi:hypothetical protein